MTNFFQKLTNLFFYGLLFLIPLFFLPITTEYYLTNKLYLLTLTVLVILILEIINLIFSKKITLSEKKFDFSLIIFILGLIVSVIISSNNKIKALTEINFGLGLFIVFLFYYFILSRKKEVKLKIVFVIQKIASLILGGLTIIYYFKPFEKINLPSQLAFLKHQFFTPAGDYLNLIFLLGFFLIFNLISFKKTQNLISFIFNIFTTTVNFVGLGIAVYTTIKNQLVVLPPFYLSWYAVLETFKNLKSAIFGFGIGNFINIFPLVKNIAYNQSPLWTFFSFNYSRSALFHLITETGLIGAITFFTLLYLLIKKIFHSKDLIQILVGGYLLIFLVLFPPSLLVWFYFFTFISLISEDKKTKKEIHLETIPNFLMVIFTIVIILIIGGIYLVVNNYVGEIYFKRALEENLKNNPVTTYDNLKKARLINPYEERYILNFSQFNINYALSYLNYLTNVKKVEKISEEDRQKIFQSIQASISEGKELIRLNPNRADYYHLLADIYRNLIAIVQQSDVWAISFYQRAISLDPNNPNYRLNLGGLYYLLQKYPDAINLFQQTVLLKPDWVNAYYNLAWGYYQNNEYDKATQSMENVLKLLDKKKQSDDWKKANNELDQFKKKLADIEKETTTSNNLNLPEKPTTELEPKINL